MALITLNNNSLSSITSLPAGLGGKIGQVITANNTTLYSLNTSDWADIGLSATITPTSTNSKILIMWKIQYSNASGEGFLGKLVRGTTDIALGTESAGGFKGTMTFATANMNSYWSFDNSGNYLDSPSTTSATTYKVQARPQGGTLTMRFNWSERQNSADPQTLSTLTLAEVLQ